MKKLLKIISKNFWIKVFCLLSALILWVYVSVGQNSVAKYPGSINIKAVNVTSGLEAVYDEKTVSIKIMAEPAVWKQLSSDSFTAFVDLAGRTEGTYDLPVSVSSAVSGVQIIEKTPDHIVVSLEKIVSKEVSVSKKIEGSAGEGLVAGAIEIKPDKVIVRGPKSQIDQITEAIVQIKLNGETEKFTKNIQVVVFDDQNEYMKNITFTPADVQVTVPIVKASNNKTVGIKVKTSGLPKTGYYVSNIQVTPAVVDITGPASLLPTTLFIETTNVDINNLDADTTKDATLSLPEGIILQSGVSSKVSIKFSISKVDQTKEISPKIVPLNLTGYTVTSYGATGLKVICSGPSDLINALTSNDVVLNLDFKGKLLADQASITFDLKSSDFATKQGISVVSILPSSITVTISK